MNDLTQILSREPFIQGLDASHIELMASCASNMKFGPNDYLGREGNKADTFYFIRSGRVNLEIHAGSRGTLTIQSLEDGDVIGWSWLVTPFRWHFDIRAVSKTRVLALDGKCLRQKCDADHHLGYTLMKKLAHLMEERLKATRMQLLDVYASPKGR